MDLQACLPADLRGPATTVAKIAAGQSGAGVYRVDAAEGTYVLKIAADGQPLDVWRSRLQIQQLAARAGLAPAVIHADEVRRAVVSAFVADRGFPMLYGNPATREAAVRQLGQTLRRLHDLPLPPGAEASDPRALMVSTWAGLAAGAAVPPFVGDLVQRVLGEEPPACVRAPVLSHNDVNPSNLLYDGQNLLLLDWDTAGANEPLYDLAAIAVFLRMDAATCERLIAAHDDAPATGLPDRFIYDRRFVAVLCGAMFLGLARQAGHAGGTGETLESAPSLGDVYQRMREGALNLATGEGRWALGLALAKEAVAI